MGTFGECGDRRDFDFKGEELSVSRLYAHYPPIQNHLWLSVSETRKAVRTGGHGKSFLRFLSLSLKYRTRVWNNKNKTNKKANLSQVEGEVLFEVSMFRVHSQARPVNRSARRRASAIVETALCLTLVILPTSLGVLQYGIVMNASSQIEQIAREGGRFSSVHCLEPTFDGDENQSNPPSLLYYLKNSVVKNKTTIAWADIDTVHKDATDYGYIQVTPSTVAARVAGQAVSVKVYYPMSRKIFVGTIVPGIKTLDNDYASTSTFVIE